MRRPFSQVTNFMGHMIYQLLAATELQCPLSRVLTICSVRSVKLTVEFSYHMLPAIKLTDHHYEHIQHHKMIFLARVRMQQYDPDHEKLRGLLVSRLLNDTNNSWGYTRRRLLTQHIGKGSTRPFFVCLRADTPPPHTKWLLWRKQVLVPLQKY